MYGRGDRLPVCVIIPLIEGGKDSWSGRDLALVGLPSKIEHVPNTPVPVPDPALNSDPVPVPVPKSGRDFALVVKG